MPVGTLNELWRYPIKSFGGERLDELELEPRGVVGDRLWALVDENGKLASGKTTRRFRKVSGLLMHSAAYEQDTPVIELSDGRAVGPDDVVAEELVGPGWTFRQEAEVPHHDAAPIHLVTTRTLARLESLVGEPFPTERVRPNMVIEMPGEAGFVEDEWVGQILEMGEVVVRVVDRTERCVMVNHARPGIERRDHILKTIGRANQACAGVYAKVVAGGRIELGAVVRLGN